ncbi:MAG: hypothetical protein PHN47_01915 [Clostridia bacterium]|jgi:hypothetical protein|nr:hypothetical protein [Clostridia bacterium]MDD4571233.1 hypothetical protein [Clostridia bacterium]
MTGLKNCFGGFGGFGGKGCRPKRNIRCTLHSIVWYLFLGATCALFLYIMVCPNFWLVLVLFMLVLGMIAW